MADWIISAPVAQIYRSVSYETASNEKGKENKEKRQSDGESNRLMVSDTFRAPFLTQFIVLIPFSYL